MSRPISVITATKRTVKGNKEVAKCVAKSSREHVAWFIAAAFLVRGRSLVPPVISRESRLLFQSPSSPARETQCRSRAETISNPRKLVALARLHPLKRAFEGRLVPQDPTDEPANELLERIRLERFAAELLGNGGRRGRRPVRSVEATGVLSLTCDDTDRFENNIGQGSR
jgi:hypothetical protein